jgi:death-on-curing protein
MEKLFEYLTLDDILSIHNSEIKLFGGSQGIRDLALLESALYRPQATFADSDLYPSIFEKAAVLMHSLILNHPFIDGNKRTGMLSGLFFLRINNISVHVPKGQIVTTALSIANKEWKIKDIENWLEQNSK